MIAAVNSGNEKMNTSVALTLLHYQTSKKGGPYAFSVNHSFTTAPLKIKLFSRHFTNIKGHQKLLKVQISLFIPSLYIYIYIHLLQPAQC